MLSAPDIPHLVIWSSIDTGIFTEQADRMAVRITMQMATEMIFKDFICPPLFVKISPDFFKHKGDKSILFTFPFTGQI